MAALCGARPLSTTVLSWPWNCLHAGSDGYVSMEVRSRSLGGNRHAGLQTHCLSYGNKYWLGEQVDNITGGCRLVSSPGGQANIPYSDTTWYCVCRKRTEPVHASPSHGTSGWGVSCPPLHQMSSRERLVIPEVEASVGWSILWCRLCRR